MSLQRPKPDDGSTLLILFAFAVLATAFAIAKSGALDMATAQHPPPWLRGGPMSLRPERTARLECWTLHFVPSDSFIRPPGGSYLTGEVHGDARFGDGAPIVTGELLGVDGTTAWTERTCYLLGGADPVYLAWLGTKGRVMDPEKPLAGVVLR